MASAPENNPIEEDSTFSDWHFVNKSSESSEIIDISDDDDSIEIIEREVEKPQTPFCSSDEEDIELLGLAESQNGNPPSGDSSTTQSARESVEFQSYMQVMENTIRNEVLNSISWKIFYSFTLAALASFIVNQYLENFAVDFAKFWLNGDIGPDTLTHPVEIGSDMTIPASNLWKTAESIPLHVADLIAEDLEPAQLLFDPILTDYSEILKSIKLYKHDMYILNVSELRYKVYLLHLSPLFRVKLINLIKLAKYVPICDVRAVDISVYRTDQLPYLCIEDTDILVFLREQYMLDISQSVGKFFQDYNTKFNDLSYSIMDSLTKSKEDDSPDGDEHEYYYEANEFCIKAPAPTAPTLDQYTSPEKVQMLEEGIEESMPTVDAKTSDINYLEAKDTVCAKPIYVENEEPEPNTGAEDTGCQSLDDMVCTRPNVIEPKIDSAPSEVKPKPDIALLLQQLYQYFTISQKSTKKSAGNEVNSDEMNLFLQQLQGILTVPRSFDKEPAKHEEHLAISAKQSDYEEGEVNTVPKFSSKMEEVEGTGSTEQFNIDSSETQLEIDDVCVDEQDEEDHGELYERQKQEVKSLLSEIYEMEHNIGTVVDEDVMKCEEQSESDDQSTAKAIVSAQEIFNKSSTLGADAELESAASSGFIYNTKPITERWSFKLYAEKPEYTNAAGKDVNGEWIMKLHKAREEIRQQHDKWERKRDAYKNKHQKNKQRKHKEKKEFFKHYKDWFKKKREDFKNDYKNFRSSFKVRIKKIKENIKRNYEKFISSDWKDNVKNMFQKWRF